MSRNDDLIHSWACGRHFRRVAEGGTGDRAGTSHFLMLEKADLVSKIGLDFLPDTVPTLAAIRGAPRPYTRLPW
jgi:hypothetical protein